MSRLLANLLLGYGPRSGGGGTPPSTPTLSVADKGDGTGATATIAGGDAGASNAVNVSPLPSATGNVAYAQAATIAGNGSGALVLTPGTYLAYAEASENGLTSLPSNTLVFRTTGGGLSSRTITPSGHFSTGLAGVAWLIASSAKFQALVGAADAAHALSSVKVEADDTEESGSARPRAIVYPAIGGFGLKKVALDNFRPTIALYVSFEVPPSATIETEASREDRFWDEQLAFLNTIEGILDDCTTNQGVGAGPVAGISQVSLSEIELLEGPSAIQEVREAGEAGEGAQYFYGITFVFHIHG